MSERPCRSGVRPQARDLVAGDAWPSETPGGLRKRLACCSDIIDELRPVSILDYGCGTGSLTRPLAASYPLIDFLGVDADWATVVRAKASNLPRNLSFDLPSRLDVCGSFGLIIVSEVLEHAEEPGQLLLLLRRMLGPGGRMFLTVPNGFGAFEAATLVETVLCLCGVARVLEVAFRAPGSLTRPGRGETLAASPHINFFSLGRLRRLFGDAGLTVLDFRPCTFVAGLGFHQLLRSDRARRWNARIADGLPYWLVSGWMFQLGSRGYDPPERLPYRRSFHERVRRRINLRRWNVGGALSGPRDSVQSLGPLP